VSATPRWGRPGHRQSIAAKNSFGGQPKEFFNRNPSRARRLQRPRQTTPETGGGASLPASTRRPRSPRSKPAASRTGVPHCSRGEPPGNEQTIELQIVATTQFTSCSADSGSLLLVGAKRLPRCRSPGTGLRASMTTETARVPHGMTFPEAVSVAAFQPVPVACRVPAGRRQLRDRRTGGASGIVSRARIGCLRL